jgi:hypothetical protein
MVTVFHTFLLIATWSRIAKHTLGVKVRIVTVQLFRRLSLLSSQCLYGGSYTVWDVYCDSSHACSASTFTLNKFGSTEC